MRIIAILALIAVILAGCVEEPFANNIVNETDTTNDTDTNETVEDTEDTGDTAETPETNETVGEPEEPKTDIPVREVIEGDLVSFPNLKATDPDGDPITYTFTSPLNEDGEWQTSEGDAGEYRVTITASDGTNEASQEVLIVVNTANMAPEIDIADEISFDEGEQVVLEPDVTDADGDNTTIKYFGWMSSNTKNTTYDDAGSHKVTIEATDGKKTTSKEVTLVIVDVNRKPVLEALQAISVTEGEEVIVRPSASDPDGDTVTFTYEKPLDSTGRWQTAADDAGEYTLDVTASDGTATSTQTVRISVESLNKAPVIELSDVTVKEGETITLNPDITDPENDEFTVTYSGWMTSNTKTTGYNDAGEYAVTITAEDTAGNEATHDILVTVEDVNRPPQFDMGSFN